MNENCSKCNKLIDGSASFFHYTLSNYWLCESCLMGALECKADIKPFEHNMFRKAFYDHYNKRYDLDEVK